MSPERPLAAAQLRLAKPGRPRKPLPAPGAQARQASAPASSPRSTRVPVPALPALGPSSSTLAPRLLDVESAAVYLSLRPGTVRGLVHGGVLRRVRIPLPDHGELRRVLLDRTDLDRLVETWKGTGGRPDVT